MNFIARSIKNRRRVHRARVPYLAWQATAATPGGAWRGICIDASPVGLGLHLSRSLTVGAPITVTVEPQQGESFTVRGRVARADAGPSNHVGMEIESAGNSLTAALHCLVQGAGQ